jgi:hypothetical protein
MKPRSNYMADIYASLTPEEKGFIQDAASMFDDGFQRRQAGEIALGIVLERRGPSDIIEGPDPRQSTFTSHSSAISAGAEKEMRRRPTRMSYKSAGDAPTLSTTEGQKLAKELGPMAIMDDDFMKLTIAKMVGPKSPSQAESFMAGDFDFVMPEVRLPTRPTSYREEGSAGAKLGRDSEEAIAMAPTKFAQGLMAYGGARTYTQAELADLKKNDPEEYERVMNRIKENEERKRYFGARGAMRAMDENRERIYKYIRDNDPGGFDDTFSPSGKFSEPIPPKKRKK